MKAEQRHDLKTNALARGLDAVPAFAQQHGNKILIGVIVVLVAVILIRYRHSEEEQRQTQSRANLAVAESRVSDLRNSPLLWEAGNQETVATLREQYVSEAEQAIEDVLRFSDESNTKAFATLARGDLNLALADFPVLPGAATRPELQTRKSVDQYLTAAENAFGGVLKEPFSSNREAVSSARLGLAAVAEDRGNWDDASKRYQEVIDNATASRAVKDYAKDRQAKLDDLKKPVLLAGPTTGPSAFEVPEAPATAPSGILGPALPGGPTSTPAALPTTLPTPASLAQPQSPATGPATQP